MTNQLISSPHDTAVHEALIVAKRRQANYYNRQAHPKAPLKVGNTVRTRWDSNSKWEKAYRAYLRESSPTDPMNSGLRTAQSNVEHHDMRDSHPNGQWSYDNSQPPPATGVNDMASIDSWYRHRQPPMTTRSGRPINRPSKLKDYVA